MVHSVMFGVLGPVEAWVGGHCVDMGGPDTRATLATLLLERQRVVPVEHLVDAVWGEAPPPSARTQVQDRVSTLRRLFDGAGIAGDIIETRGSGYVLRVDSGQCDVEVFEHRVSEAETFLSHGVTDSAFSRLSQALSLWRGGALDGCGTPRLSAAAKRLNERRTNVELRRIDLQIDLGQLDDAIGRLSELVSEHPWHERLVARLMLTLYQQSRRREALECYERLRRGLADELGVDPSPELRELHGRIRRAEPEPRVAPPVPADRRGVSVPRQVGVDPGPEPVAVDTALLDAAADGLNASAAEPDTRPARAGRWIPEHPMPSQLPTDVASFTGRERHLRQLDGLLAEPESSQTKAVVIAALSGTAGVGKSTLATHFAHRVRHRFPDGQLYVNLRGFDPSGSVMSAAEAVRGFIDAFGVPADRIPASLHAQAALYRSLLTDRRVLVLLDNARDADHVRPLLPGSPGCLVLVTSRNQLTSLVATDGAIPVTLDLLSSAEARTLLARRLGADRVAAEPVAADEIVASCARLPLAVAIVAARAATHPDFPLTALADQLHATDGLDALAGDDPTSDVRAVFSWSYHALSPAAARLFRLLGLHPGPDITAPAAASLAGAPIAEVRLPLAELVRTHLVTERGPGRYACHDLLVSYATELVHAHDPEADRHAALHRLLDYLVHTAYAADRLLDPHREQIALATSRPGVAREALADHDQALAWLASEHPILLLAVETALAAGFDTHSWQLAWAMTTFLERRGNWHDLANVHSVALRAGERLNDAGVRAHAHRRIAHFRIWFDGDSAEAHLRQALDLYRDLGDERGRAQIHLNLAVVCERRGQHRTALTHAVQARRRFESIGERAGQADACNAVGWFSAHIGNHQDALAHCQEALRLYQEDGDEKGESHAWDSLGYINNLLGRPPEAIDCYRRALALRRKLGHRYFEARALESLGDIQRATGELDSARDAWQEALAILDAFGHPDASQVRAKLETAGTAPA